MQEIDKKKLFGAAVKKERMNLGISQETLAERANLHRTYITDIERGARNLSLETIYKLASALGVSIETLFSQSVVQSLSDPKNGTPVRLIDVLLVEDDQRDVDLTLKVFRLSGFSNNILAVNDGAAALDFIFRRGQFQNRPAEHNPRLVLLDLMLPKVDGLEVLRSIKADPTTKHLQVVVLSGSKRDDHVRDAMVLGAAAFLSKPVNFSNFSQLAPKLSLQWALIGAAPILPAHASQPQSLQIR